jgi:flagellar motor component MotA
MTRYIPVLTIVLLVFMGSCGQSPQDENLKMREKIISIHDEVMPLMGKLKSLEKKANQEIETLQEQESPDAERITELKALAIDLDAAYEGMFEWMHQYEVSDGEKSPEEIKVYLNDQLTKVTEVNDKFKEVLAKADELFPA